VAAATHLTTPPTTQPAAPIEGPAAWGSCGGHPDPPPGGAPARTNGRAPGTSGSPHAVRSGRRAQRYVRPMVTARISRLSSPARMISGALTPRRRSSMTMGSTRVNRHRATSGCRARRMDPLLDGGPRSPHDTPRCLTGACRIESLHRDDRHVLSRRLHRRPSWAAPVTRSRALSWVPLRPGHVVTLRVHRDGRRRRVGSRASGPDGRRR
jgi:hypothetical protein